VLFLHFVRDSAIQNLARHQSVGSVDEAGNWSYIWKARRHTMRPSDKITGLEVVKRTVGFSIGLQKVTDWRLKELAPTQTEEESTGGLHAGAIGAPATTRYFAPENGRNDPQSIMRQI
jgi:hypothetical protein